MVSTSFATPEPAWAAVVSEGASIAGTVADCAYVGVNGRVDAASVLAEGATMADGAELIEAHAGERASIGDRARLIRTRLPAHGGSRTKKTRDHARRAPGAG